MIHVYSMQGSLSHEKEDNSPEIEYYNNSDE